MLISISVHTRANNGNFYCFPCCHTIDALNRFGIDLNVHVDPYCSVEALQVAYSKSIFRIPTLWKPETTAKVDFVLSPICKRPAGRPKKKRIPSRLKKVSQIRCGKLEDHNRKTFKELCE